MPAPLEAPDVSISLTRAAELSGRKVETLRMQAVRGRLRSVRQGREHFTTRRWLHEYLQRTLANDGERFLAVPAGYQVPE